MQVKHGKFYQIIGLHLAWLGRLFQGKISRHKVETATTTLDSEIGFSINHAETTEWLGLINLFILAELAKENDA